MTATRTLTALIATAAIALCGATTANAGKYRHLACPGTLADGSAGWQLVGVDGHSLRGYEDCGSGGWMRADIWIQDGYPVAGGRWSGWRYRAPANTRITAFGGSLAGWMQAFNNYYEGAIIIRDERTDGTVDLQWFEDRNGHNALLNDSTRPLAIGYNNLSTTQVAVSATCASPAPWDPAYYCNAWSPVWMAFKNAWTVLEDNQVPQGGTVTGTLTASGTLAGTKTLSMPLTDQGGGVRQLVVKADGAEITRSQLAGGSCVPSEADNGQGAAYTAPIPCPSSITASVAIDTKRIADGTHTITATAIDAAGNSTTVYEAEKTIANIAPTNTVVPTFSDAASAASPAPGRPIDALRGDWDGPNLTYSQQWQRCSADGGSCVDIAGATGTRYTPTTADSGFRLKFTVTAVNLAGSLTKTTTMTGVVAAPEQSPTAVAQNGNTIKTPDLPSVNDGTGRGVLNGNVIGSDDNACSKDQFVLRATRYKGRIVRLRYGSKVAIRVKLTCQTGGYPIAGAKLQTATLIPGQTQPVGGEVITDKKGEAIIRAERGPSRGITIGYRLYTREDLLRAELRLKVAVRGRITLTVTQGLGGQARFHGRVIGGYIPARGVTVQLQFLDPRDGWRPIKNMTTDNRGRYSYRYQFKQPVSFRFRAVVAPGQTDYPYMPARSKPRIGHG